MGVVKVVGLLIGGFDELFKWLSCDFVDVWWMAGVRVWLCVWYALQT
jgi:hypothetical protein